MLVILVYSLLVILIYPLLVILFYSLLVILVYSLLVILVYPPIKDLDETKEVMYKTIDQVLRRGESIESIMEKSEDLSASSMKFYETSKKTRCCTIL